MRVTRNQLKDIIVETVRQFRATVERHQVIDAVEQHLRDDGHWEADDDLDSESTDPKSKGRAEIDYRLSDLKRERRLETPRRNQWRFPQGGPYLDPEDGQPDGDPSDPNSETVMRAIRVRRGQPAFRNALRERYENRCVITGCPVLDVLEAAHIRSYHNSADNAPENGLLLRADIHTLFDLDLLGIEPDSLTVHVHPRTDESYAPLAGQPVALNGHALDRTALAQRWAMFQTRLQDA
ncbi:MAG: hypothetical protein DHS20C16_12400 [Phycisphaerae bacterium]|nr:MAG: hypothetical protein DHS20C16_12400 [Phycisphaerae bacterium]